ncbi:HNH endonuclease [Pseudomonas alcaligenes]|uniref:HNH endonuclease n=1 Tax=Aquipseudomonas alcaligenes TaxID=43263 RepID=UPI00358E2C68
MDARQMELMESLIRLSQALVRGRSERWCIRLWSRYIKARDRHQCVRCQSKERIQAHHIFRRSLYPWGWYQPGNGITLCHECHWMYHEGFNGRPDLNQPIDAQGGDNLDDVAYSFWLLLEDARDQGLSEDEFYFFEDHMLFFFVRVQGYEFFLDAVAQGQITRLRMAYEIWRRSGEMVINDFIKANMPSWGEGELFISI